MLAISTLRMKKPQAKGDSAGMQRKSDCRGQYVRARCRHRADRFANARPRFAAIIRLSSLAETLVFGRRPRGRYVGTANSPTIPAPGHSAVYVERNTSGLTFGKRERLMGFRGIASADMFFDNVTVPLEHMIVPAGGFRQLMEAFDLERCGNSTMSLGIAAGALDYVLNYVQERKQFGKPIVEFQAVQLKLAEMAMKVEACRLLIHRAVVGASQGMPSIKESSIAKCYANEMVREVTGAALQLMGGYGYSKEFGMEQRLRDGWGWGIGGRDHRTCKRPTCFCHGGQRFDQRR